MGILERLGLRSSALDAPTDSRYETHINFVDLAAAVPEMTVEQLWREQPHLRTVTSFIARMVATVSLHVYERMEDGGRARVRDSYLAQLMHKPNEFQTLYRFLFDSVMDFCLYDEFVWYIDEDPTRTDRFRMYRIPPSWIVHTKWDDPWHLTHVAVNFPTREPLVWLDGDRIIRSHGYSPSSVRYGDSPINALRGVLKEQIESAAYRAQLWHNGPRLGGVITRPQDAKWDAVARRRFKQSWQSTYAGSGSGAGGVPVLEDGMEFKPFHLKAQDEQVVEMTKLSLSTVAQVYHVNPTMVGLLDNANYSNVKEFRQSLYGDSLGPMMKQIEELLNFELLPRLAALDHTIDPSEVYLEFNIEERLRGRFEEQAAVTSTAVGGPWMTRNEARVMNNLPKVDGGDELIVPLNVSTGGDEDYSTPDGADEEAPR